MNRLRFVCGIVWFLFWVAVAVYILTRPTRPNSTESQIYSSFVIDLDRDLITIRNTGTEALTNCEIEFTAELDEGATYQGKRFYKRWEPGQFQEIGISTSQGATNVRSVRFTGYASSPDKGPRHWQVVFPTGAE